MKKEYQKIVRTEGGLTKRTGALIISALTEKGRISFRPEGFTNEDDFNKVANEDYPIVVQLCGKHDSPDVRITDVYLGADGAVYADGIDNETEEWRKDFYVIEDQFRHILHFMAVVLEWNQVKIENDVMHNTNSEIMEMAAELAEKAMVDKYNKLPEDFMDGENYKEEYQDTFNNLYDEYFSRIATLANFEFSDVLT